MSESIALDPIQSQPNQNAEGPVSGEIEPVAAVSKPHKECFIPVTRFAILERLSDEAVWRPEEVHAARRFLSYLGAWRHQDYSERLLKLKEAYLPFSPDRDTVRVLEYTPQQMQVLQQQLIKALSQLLIQANYERITQEDINDFFVAKSPYELNLKVDLGDFDEVLVFSRGSGVARQEYRTWRKFYFGKEIIEVPVFQRLFLLLKLKPEAERIREIMEKSQVNEEKANKILAKIRKNLPEGVTSDHIYLKLFKNINQSDLEMLFPNTKVEFRLFDKIKFAVTAGGGTVSGVVGAATKALAASNPITLVVAIIGLAAVLFRQVMSFFNQRTKYMMVLAQNLYFHNLANNRGVLTLLVDRAEEEDIKEEMLLYAYLAQADLPRRDLHIAKQEIEATLQSEFNVTVNYDIEDALSRLVHDNLVADTPDGWLRPLRPPEAADHLQRLWRDCLNANLHDGSAEA